MDSSDRTITVGLVGLVGCASQKLQRRAPAREHYVSQLFKKASAYAELTCDRWYILSAKHGLVRPDEIIEPYDMRLGTNDRTSPPIHSWATGVRDQLDIELADLEHGPIGFGVDDFLIPAIYVDYFAGAAVDEAIDVPNSGDISGGSHGRGGGKSRCHHSARPREKSVQRSHGKLLTPGDPLVRDECRLGLPPGPAPESALLVFAPK